MKAASVTVLRTVGVSALLAAVAGLLVTGIAGMPAPQIQIAAYVTDLTGRSRAQRHNALLAAYALDGHVILPGQVFSFNHAVQSWSADQGYVKAPVSYNGDLIPAFGGGVCQTSTTLYAAALRAGCPIMERHHHVFAPHYCDPGGDAAVAYPSIDLRFRNPYPFALRLRASAAGQRLRVELWGARRPSIATVVEPHVLDREAPGRSVRLLADARAFGAALPGASRGRNPGMVGYRVVTYRLFEDVAGREIRRERVSDDSYPSMDRVVTVAEQERPAL